MISTHHFFRFHTRIFRDPHINFSNFTHQFSELQHINFSKLHKSILEVPHMNFLNSTHYSIELHTSIFWAPHINFFSSSHKFSERKNYCVEFEKLMWAGKINVCSSIMDWWRSKIWDVKIEKLMELERIIFHTLFFRALHINFSISNYQYFELHNSQQFFELFFRISTFNFID